MSLWEDVKSNLVELYTTTSEKTTEIARVTTRKYDKFGISRDIERQFSELGNLVYTGLKEGREDLLNDPAIETLMTRIEGLENELSQKDLEIDEIRQDFVERKTQAKAAAAAAGTETVADAVITDPEPDTGPDVNAVRVDATDAVVCEAEVAAEVVTENVADAAAETLDAAESAAECDAAASEPVEGDKPENAG